MARSKTLGRMARTIVLLRAIVLHHGLGYQGNHFAPIGVDERSAQHLMGIGDGAMAVVPLSTRGPVNLLRGKIPRAIESYKVVALDKHHLLKHFAALQGAKDVREQWTEALRRNGVEYLAHCGITEHPLNAVAPLHIALG